MMRLLPHAAYHVTILHADVKAAAVFDGGQLLKSGALAATH
jgi:hypothetical protein